MALATGDKLGPYEILSLLGAGGMGEVYRARDARLGREVAIKISAERFSDRFEREARAVAALNHPNICTLYDVGPNYLVMELVEGPTLADRIREGAVPLDEALHIANQVAEALEAAHEKGIIHRDLKPGNIKIKPGGVVKVLDFGLAKVTGAATASGADSPTFTMGGTQAGMILGTAAYMSPEQARGRPVDTRSDVWAFGVVLYETLAGRQLFRGETVTDVLASVVKEEPDLARVPARVRRLLDACLRKDPRQRLHHIADAKLLLDETVAAAPPPRVRTSRAAWLLSALCLIGAAIALWAPWRAAPQQRAPVRFQIQSTARLGSTGVFAVSPDGRRLAFAAAGEDGVQRLWLRSLDSLDERPLAGTEFPSLPPPFFWSPDSRFIAYQDAGKLYKVDIAGGAPQALCGLAGLAIGGSWSPEGVILIGNSSGGIMRVSADGGAVTPVVALDSARKEVLQAFPSFLPDRRHFLYFRGFSEAEGSGTYLGSLDARPDQQNSRKLLPFGALSVVHVPGRLLFKRGGTLVSQEFDERRLELKGEPAPMAESVGAFLAFSFFSASNNGVLVYRSTGREESQLTWFDRQGKVAGKAGQPGRYNELALSPDGARAAISCTDRQRPIDWDLWLLDLARDTSTRLTFGPARADHPVWSPDGAFVAYTWVGGGPGNLYRKATNGAKEEEILLKSREPMVPTSWSRDGHFLLLTFEDSQRDVWVLPLGGEARPIRILGTPFNEEDAQFSPDMHWIAYTSNESGKAEIYVRGFAASNPGSSDGAKWLVSNGGGTRPRWRGDGKELFYIAPDGKVMSVEVRGSAFPAAVPKPLFQLPAGFGGGDVSADGKRFLFAIPVEQSAQAPFTVVLNW